MLDLINIMSYDTNGYEPIFNPIESFNSYRAVYKGPLLLGFQPPIEGWGNGKITYDLVKKYINAIVADQNSGMFVWAYKKTSLPGHPTTKEMIDIAYDIFKNNPVQLQAPPQQAPPQQDQLQQGQSQQIKSQQVQQQVQSNEKSFDFIEWINSKEEYKIGAIVILVCIVLFSILSVILIVKN
jgi:hypothetical protein